MIIPNGTVEFKVKTGGGIDATTGYPTAPEESWGEPIECQYIITSRDNLGRVNGEHFIRAQYTIYIEKQRIISEQLRLRDDEGDTIGEFSILCVKQLDAVNQSEILV